MLRKDPATAFEKSWKLFQEPRKQAGRPADVLGGMMEVRILGLPLCRDTDDSIILV